MAGKVEVLYEADDCWVVACFKDDCPEHGLGGCAPWVDDDHATEASAKAAAQEHRAYIRDYWQPDDCPTCGQKRPTAARTDLTATTTEERTDEG